MSSYGLRIENPSGTLVVDADGSGHTYRGRATMSVSQSKSLDGFGRVTTINPWQFTWTAASSSALPLFAVGVESNKVFSIVDAVQSGANWTISVFGLNLVNCESGSLSTSATPTVYVFEPGTASGSYGLRLFDASGNVTYDLANPPLMIREGLAFPARTGAKYGAGTATGDWTTYKGGDSQSRATALSNYAVFGTCDGQTETYVISTGEEDILFQFGWCLDSGVLNRVRHFIFDNRPVVVAGGDTDTRISRYMELYACTALLLDASLLP